MKKIIIGSMDENAGKTTLITGLAQILDKPFGYMKPMGDRLVYQKKRVWDYDAALMSNIFHLGYEPENITVGFEHLKLRFKYDKAGTNNRILEMAKEISGDKEILFVEGAKSIEFGISLYLDVISVTDYLKGKLIMVVGGDDNYVVDSSLFLHQHLSAKGIDFRGIVINKVRNIEDFNSVYMPILKKSGVNILGIIPYEERLTFFSMEYLSQYLLARIIAGEDYIKRRISNIFVGAATVDSVFGDPRFHKTNKLMITSGDRSDMLLASFEDSCTAAIILTNNILPPKNILAKAEEKKIPVLMVPHGVYETARQIETLTPLITAKDSAEIELMAKLVKENINIDAVLAD